MNASTDFAARLRRLGVNDSQAARLLHRSRETISKWRTGRGEPDALALAYLDIIEQAQGVIASIRRKVAKGKG
jgi:DNA-binding transcriptional regulator YiaG